MIAAGRGTGTPHESRGRERDRTSDVEVAADRNVAVRRRAVALSGFRPDLGQRPDFGQKPDIHSTRDAASIVAAMMPITAR